MYAREDYPSVIREIEAQLTRVEGTTYADSVHQYLYKYARAQRKVHGAAAGAEGAERVYKLVEARGITDHQLEALFDLSWYYYDIGEMRQCARVDSIAVSVADGDPAVRAGQRGRARQYLAFDYSVIGDHARSAHWALAALDVYAKGDSISAVQWAESHTAVGAAYWHLGRIRAAEEQYLKALEHLGEARDLPSLIRKVSAHGNLGVMWQNAGDFIRAKASYYESLRASDRVIASTDDPFTRDEALVNRSRTYLNLATVYAQLGDDGRARELLAIAWKDRSSVLEAGDPQLLSVKERMADLELGQGALDKAGDLIMEYLTACERHFGPRSEEYLRACSKLGEVAQRKGRFTQADSLFGVCINASAARPDAATDVVLAETYGRRSRLAMARGQMDRATADLLLARNILVRTYDSTHFKVAGIDVRLAEVAYASSDPRSALKYSNSAIDRMSDRVRQLNASRVPMAFPDPHILPDAIYWKVMSERALTQGGAPDPAWSAELDLGISALSRNKSAVEDEGSKLLLIGSQERLFDLALAVAGEACANSGSERDAERFLMLSEVDRSILLKGRLNGFAGLRYAGVPDSIIAREQELITALDLDEEDRQAAGRMDENERAYAEFLVRLERQHPHYFDLRYGEPKITLAGSREQLLTPDRDLLCYAFTDSDLFLLVVRMDTTALVRVPNTGIAQAVDALNRSIRERDGVSFARLAAVVYDKVFAPVAPLLREPELLIIPDGPLRSVNFEALLFEPADRGGLSEHMLIRKHAIAYLLSATTAVQFKALNADRKSRVLAIAPGFSDELKQDYLSHVPDSTLIDHAYLRQVRQPFAVTTAQQLGSLLNARVSTGAEASEALFRAEAKEHGILHLGTHAEMNASSPLYSRLVLSKDGAGVDPDADGYLHAYEIYELDLRAELAVLTACETGIGASDAEGVRSLGHSFAYAGCPSLITSLWSIDEQVSSEIITRFYGYLADGMPKHLALRQAKLDHLDQADDELALPYYWAGMVLVGDVDPIAGTNNAWRYLWWLLAAVSLAGLLIWWRKRNR